MTLQSSSHLAEISIFGTVGTFSVMTKMLLTNQWVLLEPWIYRMAGSTI